MQGAPREIVERQLGHCAKADPRYAEGVAHALGITDYDAAGGRVSPEYRGRAFGTPTPCSGKPLSGSTLTASPQPVLLVQQSKLIKPITTAAQIREGEPHVPTKQTEALGRSVVDRPDPGFWLCLCAAERARAVELHAGRHHRVVRIADGALVGRQARGRTGTQCPAQRALRPKRSSCPGGHHGPGKTGARGRPRQTASWRHLGKPSGDAPGPN